VVLPRFEIRWREVEVLGHALTVMLEWMGSWEGAKALTTESDGLTRLLSSDPVMDASR
jgi:hypothetical protein